jgi:hypothetical protein
MSESKDDRLLRDLRRLAREVDAVPDEVTAYAKAALGWRRVDAELAELLSDSHLETGIATTRAGESSIRSLTFRSGELEIAVEIHQTDAGVRIMGQLAPAAAATVEVQRDDETVAGATEADSLGRFLVDLDRGGRLRLLVHLEPPARPIETSWLDA